MIIDTHAHFQMDAFNRDRDEAIKKTLQEGISFVMPGTNLETSRAAVELAEKLDDPRVYAAIGLHPTEETEFQAEEFKKIISSPKVIAVGETGLDYWRKPKTTARKEAFVAHQKDILVKQLDMAVEYKKPLIIHCRVAHHDLLDVLEGHTHIENPPAGGPGVVHSYTGDLKQLKKFLDFGFYIGVNALVFTLPFVEEAVSAAPLDRIVLETDSPYLVPPGVTEERNEPIFIKHTAQKIAEIKKVSLGEVETQTTKNTQNVFGVNFD